MRLIVTEAVMTVVVVVMVIVLTFVAMGYKLNQDGELSQNGLVQISSLPTGASVMIDGDGIFPRTDTSRSLSAGHHTIELSRAGYDTWKKTIEIQPGWLYKLDYPRLFRGDREAEQMLSFEEGLEFFSISPTRNGILYADENSTTFTWLRLRGDEMEKKELEVADLFRLEKSDRLPGVIREIIWNDDGDRVLIDYVNGDTRDKVVLNLAKVEDSINLTREFGLDFSKVRPASSTAERLVALENGNLRIISIGSKEMSRVLLGNVADFANLDAEVLFVTNPTAETNVKTVGYYMEGDKTPILLETVGGDGVKLAVSKYLDKRYLTIAVGPEVSVYKAENIREMKSIDDFTLVKQVAWTVAPEKVEVHNRGRLITATNGRKVLVFDAEQANVADLEFESDPTGWLDGFMLTNVLNGRLVVRDFDGENRRDITNAKAGFSAVVTSNEKYLYYMVECGTNVAEKSCLMREKL